MARTEPFDTRAAAYDDWFVRYHRVYQTELKAVAHLLPASGEGLEVGVGSGRFAEPLGIKIGVEPSERMRKLAESRGITVYKGIAENLPFPDECFDFILITTTICFIDDVDKSFQEVHRVLGSHGSFVLGFVDKDGPLGRFYQRRKGENVFYREATFFGCAEVKFMLERSGFETPEIIQTVFGRLEDIGTVQDFKKGYGEGGFVVMRAVKTL
jgi:SAM-dependent methyltransferase